MQGYYKSEFVKRHKVCASKCFEIDFAECWLSLEFWNTFLEDFDEDIDWTVIISVNFG